MIPMGSVVTACMIVGLIVALPPMVKGCPKPIRLSIGVILLAAGLWNILWKPVVLLMLLGFAALYAIKIYSL